MAVRRQDHPMGIQFLVGAIIARHLGSEGFGVLNVALAMTGLVAVVASLGSEGIPRVTNRCATSNANLLKGIVFFTRLGAVLMLYPILAIVALNEPVHNQATFSYHRPDPSSFPWRCSPLTLRFAFRHDTPFGHTMRDSFSAQSLGSGL